MDDMHITGRRTMWKPVLGTMTLTLILTTAVMTSAGGAIDREGLDNGRTLYLTYCASCHGVGGRGDGPAAEELRHRPADLTQFANRNGGVFNAARIEHIVDGRTVKAHGTLEMPVWGDAFKFRGGLPEEAI